MIMQTLSNANNRVKSYNGIVEYAVINPTTTVIAQALPSPQFALTLTPVGDSYLSTPLSVFVLNAEVIEHSITVCSEMGANLFLRNGVEEIG